MHAPSQIPDLPDKPSDLIRKALSDLKSVENDRSPTRYNINMDTTWYLAFPTSKGSKNIGRCYVCLAGAVIARSGPHCTFYDEQTGGQILQPQHFDDSTKKKLFAIDYFRQGNVYRGLSCMGFPIPLYQPYGILPVTNYRASPETFFQNMESIAQWLEDRGY